MNAKNISITITSVLIFFVLFFLSWGQIGRVSFLNQQINVYVYEVPLAILVCWLGLLYRQKPLYEKNIIRKLLLFLVVMSVSWIVAVFSYSWWENSLSLLYLLRLWLYGLYFIYLYYFIDQYKGIRYLHFTLGSVLILTILTSFVQYIWYPDLRNLEYAGWDPHLYRMFGVFLDPPVAAAFYGLLLLFIYFHKKLLGTPKFIWILLGLLGLIVILTYSRGAFLAGIVVALVYALQKKKQKELIIGLVLFVLLVSFIPKRYGEGVNLLRTSTVASRLEDYKTGLSIWLKRPLLGIGYNHIRREKIKLLNDTTLESSHAGASFHSSFLIVLATGGIIGLIALLFFLYHLSKLSEFSRMATIFVGVMSLTDNVLLHPFIFTLLSTLICFSIIRRVYSEL